MRAMRLDHAGGGLALTELPDPVPGAGEILIRVTACGVCRTDLHVVDGDLPRRTSPITPGHEIVGIVAEAGRGVTSLQVGMRVGVGWLGATCGVCSYCVRDRENLCDNPVFTGYTRDGGFATHALADARFAYELPADLGGDADVAPLLCAGLIGWRSLVAAGPSNSIGLYGFGAAAHIILQVAKWQGREVFVFTRAADQESKTFALQLGADWVGGSDELPPQPLDAAIIYAPVGALVPAALKAVRKGGRVVCAGIHMSDIPSFPYEILWGEREIVSVANLSRRDAAEFLSVARQAKLRTRVTAYPLTRANEALNDLRSGRIQGAAVLVPQAPTDA